MARGQGIKKLNTLFDVYKKKLKAPQGVVIQTFQEVVGDLFSFEVEKEKCSYSTATKILHITLPGPFKTEILLRKKDVLNHLKGRLGEKSAPKDIV